MNFFRFRTVFKATIVSRVIPGYFLLSMAACREKQEQVPFIKIPKTIDSIFIQANDNKLSSRQDTVCYNGQYFTGYIFTLYDNGDTAALGAYFNGVEENWQRKWYPGGQLAEERFYINGKKEGRHRGWWPNGKQKFEYTVDGDQYDGEFREWYASGLLGKQFHYIKGQEEGSQRLWWDNGSVRANYVIRNGKKYGLIGLQTWSNPYDSVVKK
jgi:hypothetical protein